VAAAVAIGLGTVVVWSVTPPAPLATHPEPTGARLPPAYRWLAEHGEGRPLLELPRPRWDEAAERMLLSTHHWLPIVDGYSGYPVEAPNFIHAIAVGLPRENVLQSLVDHVDLGWILLHGVPPDSPWRAPLPAGLAVERTWDGDVLVRVTRPMRDDLRGRLFDRERTLDGTPLRALRSCRGTIALADPIPVVPSSAPMAVWIDVRNEGPDTWPARGFVPRHLVRLVWCVRRENDANCLPTVVPIPTDVRPDAVVEVPVFTVAPLLPGRYVFHARLTQVRDGPLARCGVAPLEVAFDVRPRAR
jgi:hypothetical protein